MAISDLKGIFQKHVLRLANVQHEHDHIYSFTFKPNVPFEWKAGQHGGLKVNGKAKPFTIGSTTSEGHILITTEIRNSDYKRALMNLKEQDTVTFNGPIGGFYIKDRTKPHLLVGEEIGIVPFRSITKQLLEEEVSLANFQMVFLTKTPIYHDVWEMAKEKGANIMFCDDEIIFNSVIEECSRAFQQNGDCFVCGKPNFVKDTVKKLNKFGIKKVHKDSFIGY